MVSVCIATYNGEKYIIKQVQSILHQLSCEDEIIISDDGSSDNTINFVKNIGDHRIKIINGPCKGYIQNFSNAITHASGDYIFLSDQDDEWMNDKINTVCPLLDKYMLVMHNANLVDGDGCDLGEKLFPQEIHFSLLKNLIKHQTYGCCISFRAELKKIILPIPNNRHLLHETWISCLCQLVYHKSLYYINQPLINYRRHGNNISQLKISNRKYSDRIIERLVLSFYLLIRYLKYIFYPS